MLAQCLVDQRLVAGSTSGVSLLAKPLQEIIVDANRDSRLSRGCLQYRPPLSTRKVVLSFHDFAPYCPRSCGVAWRAEMRGRSSRHV
jgi:hypothetical protein